MAIADNVTIDYTNKIIDVTDVDSSTPYDILNLYSYAKEEFKLSANIDDDFAYDAPTPFDLTLKNGWYMRRHGIPRVSGGSITTAYGTDVIGMYELNSGGTAFVEGDIGLTVRNATQATNFGTLVDFDNNRNAIWVRLSSGQHNAAASDTIECTTAGGTGSKTSTGVENYGNDQWTGIKTIGDLVTSGPQPLMYVYVGDTTTGDFAAAGRRYEHVLTSSNHREDDPNEAYTNVDRGAIDSALIAITESGNTLGNPAGEIRVYGRHGLDTYSDFAIDITAGGLISIPISNGEDSEDTLGEFAIAVDGIASGPFTNGEEITEDTATPTWKAEIVTQYGTQAATRILVLRSLTGTPADNDTFTGASSSATGVVRGTVGGQVFAYDVETDGILEADYAKTLTSDGAEGWQGLLRGHLTIAEGTTTVGYAVCESNHDFNADPDYYDVLDDNSDVTATGIDVTVDTATLYTRLASDLDDIRIKACVWDLTVGSSATFAVGDDITQQTSGAKGTIVSIPDGTSIFVSQNNTTSFNGSNDIDDDNSADTTTVSNAVKDETFDYALNLQSSFPYTILIDANGRTASEIYQYAKFFQQARATAAFTDLNGVNADPDNDREFNMLKERAGGAVLDLTTVQGEEYFRAFTDDDGTNSYTIQDAKSRLVVNNGGSLVTGQGVAIFDIAPADGNNFTLTDANGTAHIPEVSITITITNNVIGAHLHIALDDGSGQEDKAQFTSHNTNNSEGDTTFEVTTTIPNDTPLSGTIKVVDTGNTTPENREMRYRYDSWSGTAFTLTAAETGQAEGASSGNTLVDTGAFASVEVGDPIRNTTDGSYGWVKEKTDANTIVTTQLEGGTSNDWANLDNWETNTLVVTYTNADTAYVPYLDIVVDTATEAQSLTFVSNRNIVLVHRDEDYIDVTTQGTITSSGFSFRISQTADSRYTPT